MALVFFVIFFSTFFGFKQNVFLSISAKTGFKFQNIIENGQALIVKGDVIISSPCSKSSDPTAAISPDVQELKVIAYFTLKKDFILFSNLRTLFPPLNFSKSEAR